MWKRREKELAYCFDSLEEEFDKPQRDEYYGKVKLEDVTNKVVKGHRGKVYGRRMFADILLFATGGILVYIVYRFITYLNFLVLESVSINKEQKNMRLYWIGMTNGIMNFMLAQIYFLVAEVLVKWENHP